MRVLRIAAVACMTACAHARPPFRAPDECNRGRFDFATRYDSTQWRAMEGAFRLIRVDTVNKRVIEVDLLRLGPLDSAKRAEYTPPFQIYRPGGRIEIDSTPRRMPKLSGLMRWQPALPLSHGWVAFDNGYIGKPCPPSSICADGNSLFFRVTHVADTGFLGKWGDPLTSIYVYIDPKTKRELAAPYGYFCAIQRDDSLK